ncbi:MAG: FAD-dependent oxidoreductase, partial [Candidatus Nitrotoga sp.]
MTQIIEIKVPDIGDFKDVPVIAVLVKAGEKIAVEQTLLTLETDKATVDVPSPSAGVVKELRLKQWDKVNTGSAILTLEVADAIVAPTPTPAPEADVPASAPGNTPSPVVATAPQPMDKDDPVPKGDWHAEVVVIGAGPGGYTAAFRAADLGKQVILIERHSRLGGVCLNVGCIPSKALLHVAKVIAEADDVAHHGVTFSKPAIDIDKVRSWKDDVINKLTGGLSMLAKQRKVQVVTGTAQFSSANSIIVQTADGAKTITFDNAVIAAGSSVARIPGFPYDDPRLIDSTGALLLQDIPARLLIIGGGIIGLEMATVYDALSSKITVVELADGLMPGADRDLVRALHKRIEKRYEAIYLKTKVTKIEALPQGLQVTFAGDNAPAPQLYDRVLLAVGRRPNGREIAAQQAGVTVDERGFIPVNKQQRTNVAHIYAIGDI